MGDRMDELRKTVEVALAARKTVPDTKWQPTSIPEWAPEIADLFDQLARYQAVVEMVKRGRESIENQADWNRKHPTMTNDFVTIHISGEGAPEALLEALASLDDPAPSEPPPFVPQPPIAPTGGPGQDYMWPHHPECSYVASNGVMWCDCHAPAPTEGGAG
jgi:hypothetical protein